MRATLILLLAVLTGIGTGLLAALAGRHPADAVLMGTAATATATAFFNWVIARN
ncbi:MULTISPECIES: hypothetical protein [Actinosynnema]|uniref:hypothetical protein n=1 Tax=Actinosynnema TaxID=40566 RepID=UPI0020A3F79C|nr:hypothetical protein [Actinosynnema pretiosum]